MNKKSKIFRVKLKKKILCNFLYVRNVVIFRGFFYENVKELIVIRLNLFMKMRKSWFVVCKDMYYVYICCWFLMMIDSML